MSHSIDWLRQNPDVAYLLFLLLTGLLTEIFRKRSPAEEAALASDKPRLLALRELLRGIGVDGPKVRGALALLLLGKRLEVPPELAPAPAPQAPPTPRDPGLYPPSDEPSDGGRRA